MADKNKYIVNRICNHIGNDGVAFGVTNEYSSTISIDASHFGIETNGMRINVDKDALRLIGEMFLEAYEYNNFDEPQYICEIHALRFPPTIIDKLLCKGVIRSNWRLGAPKITITYQDFCGMVFKEV